MDKEEVFEIYELDDAKRKISVIGFVVMKPMKQIDLEEWHRTLIVILTRASYYNEVGNGIHTVFFDNGDQYVQI